MPDFAAADFASQDSLTRGQQFLRSIAARHTGLVLRDGHALVDDLRAKKSAAEFALLRKAAEISSEGHRAAMTMAEPFKEYQIQAVLEYAFLSLGGARPSYGYTPAQRDLYQLVLDAQLAAERNSKPGMLASSAQDSSIDIRERGLAKLGLIESVDAQLDMPWQTNCTQNPRSCRQSMFWMIHGISHGIGLDVHDPAQFYTGDRRFKEGDAFTIEPGLYVSSTMLDALPDTPRNRAFIARVRPAVAKYENTGVRIEDDYIITSNGLERISTAPCEMAEIEALMRTRPPRAVP